MYMYTDERGDAWELAIRTTKDGQMFIAPARREHLEQVEPRLFDQRSEISVLYETIGKQWVEALQNHGNRGFAITLAQLRVMAKRLPDNLSVSTVIDAYLVRMRTDLQPSVSDLEEMFVQGQVEKEERDPERAATEAREFIRQVVEAARREYDDELRLKEEAAEAARGAVSSS